MLKFKKFKLRHIYQKANGVADLLPKATVRSEKHFMILSYTPSSVMSTISSDMIDIAKIRLVTPS